MSCVGWAMRMQAGASVDWRALPGSHGKLVIVSKAFIAENLWHSASMSLHHPGNSAFADVNASQLHGVHVGLEYRDAHQTDRLHLKLNSMRWARHSCE